MQLQGNQSIQVKKFAESYGFRSKNDRYDGLVMVIYGHERQASAWSQPPPEAGINALLARLVALGNDILRELSIAWKRPGLEEPRRES